jgi:hypothetical protein
VTCFIVGVERERFCNGAFREGRRQRIGIEDERLHGVIELRNSLQHIIGGKTVGYVASGQQRQRAEAGAAGDEAAAHRIRHHLDRVPDQQPLVDAGNQKRAKSAHGWSPQFNGR